MTYLFFLQIFLGGEVLIGEFSIVVLLCKCMRLGTLLNIKKGFHLLQIIFRYHERMIMRV